jgi:hypothetical protein
VRPARRQMGRGEDTRPRNALPPNPMLTLEPAPNEWACTASTCGKRSPIVAAAIMTARLRLTGIPYPLAVAFPYDGEQPIQFIAKGANHQLGPMGDKQSNLAANAPSKALDVG